LSEDKPEKPIFTPWVSDFWKEIVMNAEPKGGGKKREKRKRTTTSFKH